MASEYDPAFGRGEEPEGPGAKDLADVRAAFRRASRPYLSSPIPWLGWALVLPAAALATPRATAARGAAGVLLTWSAAVLVGGAVEGIALLAGRRRFGSTPVGSWAMRTQGNLSLVGAALSIGLVLADRPLLLPALWLLLLGHSLYSLGGLALPAQRIAGVVYQAGGLAALVPGVPPLLAFAAATFMGNLIVAVGVLRARRDVD